MKNTLESSCSNGCLVNCLGSLYLIGGFRNRKQSSVDVYDSDADRWKILTHFEMNLQDFYAAAVGTRIYIFGGLNINKREVTDQVLVFNTELLKFENFNETRLFGKLTRAACCVFENYKNFII